MSTEHQTFGTNQNLGSAAFVDRRQSPAGGSAPGLERRQFADSHRHLSAEAAELGRAIDQYKLINRRRFITHEEMLGIIKSLGYTRTERPPSSSD